MYETRPDRRNQRKKNHLAMEQTFIKLQELQRRAFAHGVEMFDITAYNWTEYKVIVASISLSEDYDNDYQRFEFRPGEDHEALIKEIINFVKL